MKRRQYLCNPKFSHTLLKYGEQRQAEKKSTIIYEREFSQDAKTKIQERRQEIREIMSLENSQPSRFKKIMYDPYTVGFTMIVSAALIGSLSYGNLKAKKMPLDSPNVVSIKSHQQ